MKILTFLINGMMLAILEVIAKLVVFPEVLGSSHISLAGATLILTGFVAMVIAIAVVEKRAMAARGSGSSDDEDCFLLVFLFLGIPAMIGFWFLI